MVDTVGVEPTSIQLCANCFVGSASTCPLKILSYIYYVIYIKYGNTNKYIRRNQSVSNSNI